MHFPTRLLQVAHHFQAEADRGIWADSQSTGTVGYKKDSWAIVGHLKLQRVEIKDSHDEPYKCKCSATFFKASMVSKARHIFTNEHKNALHIVAYHNDGPEA
jgi:hypothetical protein